MTWFLIKGLLLLFVFFILIGSIGNIFGWLFYKLSKKIKSELPLLVSDIFLIISSILCFLFMGLFYASFTFALTIYMKLWAAVIIVSPLIISIYYNSFKEWNKLENKLQSVEYKFNLTITEYNKLTNHNNRIILMNCYLIVLSYIFFLIFNNLANSFSLGLNNYLLSLIK
jgi:hypothetical protein